MWTTTSYAFQPTSGQVDRVQSMYPGDDVVDWIACDPYNYFHDGDWVSLGDEIFPWYTWARQNHPSKPLAFSEWGTKEDPNDPNRKAQWLHDALDALKSDFTEVKAVVYFDERKEERGDVNDWRIDTSQNSLDAFRAIAADPYFAPH
jgi:beta-mannanase